MGISLVLEAKPNFVTLLYYNRLCPCPCPVMPKQQNCNAQVSASIIYEPTNSYVTCYSLRPNKRPVGLLLLFQVSPAKFAWLVHSVGVALASLSPISSWVGLQIGYTKAVLDALGISPPLDGFLVVLRSLPYRFFPVFYLLLILIVLVSGRDFGPMASAEDCGGNTPATESKPEGEVGGGGGEGGITPKAGTPLRSRNALIPFATVIAVTFAGMILDGISKIEAGGNEVRLAFCATYVRETGFLQ